MQNQFIFKIKVEKKTSTFIIFILKNIFFNQKEVKFIIGTANLVF